MIYRQFQNLSLSGLGMMRQPMVGGDDGVVDETVTTKMIDLATAAASTILIPPGVITTAIPR